MLKLATLAGHWGRPPSAAGGGGSGAFTYLFSASVQKFDHAAGTWASATAYSGLTSYGATLLEPVCVGSATHAILKTSNAVGSASSCIKYAYADETSTTGASFTTHRRSDATLQTTTTGYLMGGLANSITGQTTVQKYLFAADTVSAGAALGTGRYAAAGIGTSSVGICAGGANTTSTHAAIASSEKYTYGTDTRASGTSLGTARALHGAVGDTVRGIFGGGATLANGSGTRIATTEKYTYSGDVRAAGTTLTTAREGVAGAGDNTFGLFIGGNSAAFANETLTQKYTFASDAVTTTGVLGTGSAYKPAKCTIPGGL